MSELENIKKNIDIRISECMNISLDLVEAINLIKTSIEEVIKADGEKGKKSLITSQQIINLIHEVIKSDLVKNKIDRSLIYPPITSSNPEITLAGFLKNKKQDICVFPKSKVEKKELISFNGLFNTETYDKYGELFTENVLSINVRSQLSSMTKNIDTMFERTYAEPLNLHRRLPKMVLGEVYLISVKELDSKEINNKNVKYKDPNPSTRRSLEKVINGFSALNLRSHQRDDDFKYERVALILVDFSCTPVKVYNNVQELILDKILEVGTTVSLENLSYDHFIENLLDIHIKRFGDDIFK